MAVTVSLEKLEEALRAKLGAARLAIHLMRESEQPELNRHLSPQQYIVDFLHAARGVYPIAETFVEKHLKQDFKVWLTIWETTKLSKAEMELWAQMRRERVAQEHGEGAGLIAVDIPITRGDASQMRYNAVLLQVDPSQNRRSKGGVRFGAYPDRLASEVCDDYFALAQRFVDDFLCDHQRLSA